MLPILDSITPTTFVLCLIGLVAFAYWMPTESADDVADRVPHHRARQSGDWWPIWKRRVWRRRRLAPRLAAVGARSSVALPPEAWLSLLVVRDDQDTDHPSFGRRFAAGARQRRGRRRERCHLPRR